MNKKELIKDLEYHIMQHKFYQNRCFVLEGMKKEQKEKGEE